ncbi:MAG: polysaccharide biosynthesis protein [Armatimonadota bacterium]
MRYSRNSERLVREIALTVHDTVVVAACCYLALVVRYSGMEVPRHLANDVPYLAMVVSAASLAVFRVFRIHRIHSSYMGFADIVTICLAALVVAGVLTIAVFALGVFGYPRGSYLIFWLLVTFLMVADRSLFRLYSMVRPKLAPSNHRRRVLILGAGATGEWALKQLQANASRTHKVVGFLDDDPVKQGIDMHRVPVLGACSDLERVVKEKDVHDVLVAMPSASGSKMRSLLRECQQLRVALKVIQGFDYPNGTSEYARPLQVEDLLTRPEVQIDIDGVARYLKGKRVLITGAGGSIGSELAKQVHAVGPEQLVLLGRGEGSIYTIEEELRSVYGASPIPVIADVTDRPRMERVFVKHRPHVIFHAAAHKHVPLMEMHPEEAVKCNILGTKNLVELARTYGSERFVLISTDKAVRPRSVMGASKRVAEMILQDAASKDGGPKYMAVRFGNVLGSRGSVVPTMQKQIDRGGPVTVTHPEMMRYFMTVGEAVRLVIQAGCMGEGGEVFVLDMGEPVKIIELAEALIRMNGKVPGKDIEIAITGIRPGEKLYEEPLTSQEGTTATNHNRIFIAPLEHTIPPDLDGKLCQLELAARNGEEQSIRCLLKELIPTYRPWNYGEGPAHC